MAVSYRRLTINIVSMYVRSIPTINMMTNNIFFIDGEGLPEFEKNATRRLIRKLDRRILPCMLLIEIGSYLNWISTGR